jgi:hypothetical protein
MAADLAPTDLKQRDAASPKRLWWAERQGTQALHVVPCKQRQRDNTVDLSAES